MTILDYVVVLSGTSLVAVGAAGALPFMPWSRRPPVFETVAPQAIASTSDALTGTAPEVGATGSPVGPEQAVAPPPGSDISSLAADLPEAAAGGELRDLLAEVETVRSELLALRRQMDAVGSRPAGASESPRSRGGLRRPCDLPPRIRREMVAARRRRVSHA